MHRKHTICFLLFVVLIGIVYIFLGEIDKNNNNNNNDRGIGDSEAKTLDLINKSSHFALYEHLIADLNDENPTFSHYALPQKCKIPVLDPYHPDVKPFIKRWSVPDCPYPELSEVTDDGVLRVKRVDIIYFVIYSGTMESSPVITGRLQARYRN